MFTQGYKTIARRLDLAEGLDGEKLLVAVRERIESGPQWLLVLDNADDLALFGVGRASHNALHDRPEEPTGKSTSLYDYVPQSAACTVLWTSRDDEAMRLLETSRDKKTGSEEAASAEKLLEELQWLPLAISQAGAYLRRTSNPILDYLSKLAEGKERWRVLRKTEFDRCRPDVPNSVLETRSISMERVRLQDEMAYRIMHVIAYVNNKDTLSHLR